MNPVPGNVYDSDLSFMDPTDPLSMSFLARTSADTLYPITAVHPVPGHLLPGVSFAPYPRSYQAVPFEFYDVGTHCRGDFNDLYQSRHHDYTTERIRDVFNVDQLVGQGFSLVPEPDLSLDSLGEDVLPLPIFPNLSLPEHTPDSWMETTLPNVDAFDAFVQELAVTKHTPWDVLNPFQPSSDGESTPSLFEVVDPASNGPYICEWCDADGSPCNVIYSPGDDLKHAVLQHLHQTHSLLPSSAKSTQRCLWRGCTKELKQESIVRHIVTVHLHVTTACKACGTSFARRDSLQRHMKNSCGASKEER